MCFLKENEMKWKIFKIGKSFSSTLLLFLLTWILGLCINRISYAEVHYKKTFLKDFANFTGKYLPFVDT